jgi:peptidoglycan/xylan/chitin deacetylase (PgdA/CDA1 family)
LHAADNLLLRHVFSPRIDVRPNRPIASFTFDDIPASAASQGAEILERHGARGTFYVAGSLIQRGEEAGYADMAALRRLAENGHELGCHTYSHAGLRNLNGSAAAHDLEENEAFFVQLSQDVKATNFAYPFNKGTLSALPALRSRFRSARGGRGGINRGRVPAFQLRGVEIAQPEAPDLADWLADTAEHPGWLIYFTHDVSTRPSPYGARPETLERLVAEAVRRGIEVLTVDAALDRLGAPQAP